MNEAADLFFTKSDSSDDEEKVTHKTSALEQYINQCTDEDAPGIRLDIDRDEAIFPQALEIYKIRKGERDYQYFCRHWQSTKIQW